MSDDDLLRALGDPDPTVQRSAAVRAGKVSSSPRVLAALEPLLAHADKYLRRAAAASYVVMHPRGPAAPALQPLLADPADVVVLTARGGVRDPDHEHAELAFVVRTLAYATPPTDSFSTTVSRWHRFLWNYSPNPRAARLALADLDADAARLHEALAALTPPDEVTLLQVSLDDVRGFVDGRASWQIATAIELPGLRALAHLRWDAHDTPWPAMFASGALALAVARVASVTWLGKAKERELSIVTAGQPIFLGFLRATGIVFGE